MRRDNVNYLWVGSFVLVMAAVLLYALYRLTGQSGQGDVYYTRFPNVAGIKTGTVVTYEGFEVGNVPGGVSDLVLGEEHRPPVGSGLVGSGHDSQIAMKALVEVVPRLCSGTEKMGGGQRAKDIHFPGKPYFLFEGNPVGAQKIILRHAELKGIKPENIGDGLIHARLLPGKNPSSQWRFQPDIKSGN